MRLDWVFEEHKPGSDYVNELHTGWFLATLAALPALVSQSLSSTLFSIVT